MRRADLRIESGFATADRQAACSRLMERVFGEDAPAHEPGTPSTWHGLFDAAGTCLAALETFALPLIADGAPLTATGLRAAGVDPACRGRGLFRDLMEHVLGGIGDALVLLYTGSPELYTRFGFRAVPQHRFTGQAPQPAADRHPCRRLDLAGDEALIRRLLAGRAAVSDHVALVGCPGLFFETVAAHPELELDYSAGLDALIVSEAAGDALVLVDIVARQVPSLPALLAALGRRPARITTLFPPDRLGVSGAPEADDTGLMARGPLPPAFNRPFMLPPTAEF